MPVQQTHKKQKVLVDSTNTLQKYKEKKSSTLFPARGTAGHTNQVVCLSESDNLQFRSRAMDIRQLRFFPLWNLQYLLRSMLN